MSREPIYYLVEPIDDAPELPVREVVERVRAVFAHVEVDADSARGELDRLIAWTEGMRDDHVRETLLADYRSRRDDVVHVTMWNDDGPADAAHPLSVPVGQMAQLAFHFEVEEEAEPVLPLLRRLAEALGYELRRYED